MPFARGIHLVAIWLFAACAVIQVFAGRGAWMTWRTRRLAEIAPIVPAEEPGTIVAG
jgi:hypothetical protein